jgi:cell shape-determining protein MreC
MKMNYQFTTNRDRKSKKTAQYAGVLTVAALAVAGMLFFAPHATSQIAQAVAVPLWKAESFVGSPFVFIENRFTSQQKLIEKNVELESQLNSVAGEIADRNALADQNEMLKTMLGRTNKSNTLLAAVLSRPDQTPYDTLIVDAGSNFGIKQGDEVLADNTILIGSISAVYSNSSQVTLFSAPNEKIPVSVGASHIATTAIGQGGGNFIITLPRGVAVKEGDTISAPDLTVQVFGTVSTIEMTNNDSFQTIRFNSPITISQLALVTILMN